MSQSPLHAIPAEILSNVALYLACDHPFRPPQDLCSLLATCRSTYQVLHHTRNGPLWSAAFRYRFDDAAVIRRNFLPSGSQYADQLRLYTETLAAVRSPNVYTDEWLLEHVLRTVYIMLLENNGKNRAQLEAAGIDVFIDIYVRTRLWLNSQSNDGWPHGHESNAHALWIMWMLTTPQKLAQESPEHREHLVALLLPYVINVYRYPQAEAPPIHFHLPLPPDTDGDLPYSFPSAHGPYPVYVRPEPTFFPYFGSMPVITPPLIAVAAKLLYIARREAIPLDVLAHLPRTRAEAPPSNDPSPTQEDVIEFNSHKAAQPPPRVTWDWDRGCKVLDGRPVFFSDNDDSIRWDCDYWRRRLCGDAWQVQPKWRPGKVYVPGSMDGLWHGRLIFTAELSMQHLATHASFPHYANFNEFALSMTHQPLFVRLKEHHALYPHPHVPLPPRSLPSSDNNGSTPSVDKSMCNAWFPSIPDCVSFTADPLSSHGDPFYSANGERKKVLISIENHGPRPDEAEVPDGWIYETYDRKLAAQQQTEAELAGREFKHAGHENCPHCLERDMLIQNGAILDDEDRWYDHNGADEAADDGGFAERLFESVGLGRDQVAPSEMEDDLFDMESVQEGNDYDDNAMEFLADNADYISPEPVRRATDRVKIEKCNGIRDIVLSGTTDRRHALAWNDFTFHGRVRPWDGLVGIIRRSAWPVANYTFFYGYLVGGDTLVGNWRIAAIDPYIPTWESTFVMSRRKDDDN